MQGANYHTYNEIKSQTEAVDGASLIQIFWKIYLPLGKPAPAARVNAICPEYHADGGPAFFQQQMTHGGKFTVLMSGALISILPLLLVFFFAQKQFSEGIAFSGLER